MNKKQIKNIKSIIKKLGIKKEQAPDILIKAINDKRSVATKGLV